MADLLVVDNDARIADLVAWFLQKGGHSPRVVTSYAAAREALGVRSFALMLADLELGAEDGRVELPRLEEEGILPKTLVVSGYLDAEITESLLQIPSVVGTVPKPFEPSELLARVDAVITSGAEGAAGAASTEEASSLREVVIQPSPTPSSEQEAADGATASVADEDGWVEITPRRKTEPSVEVIEPSAEVPGPSAETAAPSEVLAEEEDWEGVG